MWICRNSVFSTIQRVKKFLCQEKLYSKFYKKKKTKIRKSLFAKFPKDTCFFISFSKITHERVPVISIWHLILFTRLKRFLNLWCILLDTPQTIHIAHTVAPKWKLIILCGVITGIPTPILSPILQNKNSTSRKKTKKTKWPSSPEKLKYDDLLCTYPALFSRILPFKSSVTSEIRRRCHPVWHHLSETASYNIKLLRFLCSLFATYIRVITAAARHFLMVIAFESWYTPSPVHRYS